MPGRRGRRNREARPPGSGARDFGERGNWGARACGLRGAASWVFWPRPPRPEARAPCARPGRGPRAQGGNHMTNPLRAPAAAAAALALLAGAAAAGPDPALEAALDFTTLVVEPAVSPRPVEATDGRTHLVYELLLVNETSMHTRIDSIEAFDAGTGAPLGRWSGDALAEIFRLNGRLPGLTLPPGGSAYAFLDASFAKGEPQPKALKHRISVHRFIAAKNGGKLVPPDPSLGVPAAAAFDGAEVPVDPQPAVVVAPPLEGPGWVVFNGCCANLQHRAGVMAFSGEAKIPERFAIDFMRLDADGHIFNGPVHRNESYVAYGAPVYAVADGTVVSTQDGFAERTPMTPREPIRFDTAGGNYVVVDIGSGHYAFFAHLKTGSVAVKPGDRVKTGEVIAALGDTGNSDGPHLHFHVMDGPSPLASNGIPYVFTAFKGAGGLAGDNERLFETGVAKLDKARDAGPHAAALPLDVEIVDFPLRPRAGASAPETKP